MANSKVNRVEVNVPLPWNDIANKGPTVMFIRTDESVNPERWGQKLYHIKKDSFYRLMDAIGTLDDNEALDYGDKWSSGLAEVLELNYVMFTTFYITRDYEGSKITHEPPFDRDGTLFNQ